MYQETPGPVERIVSGLTYPTLGLVGVVWLIIGALAGSYPKRFTMYHIFQSVFLSLLYIIVNWVFWQAVNVLSLIPVLNRIVRQIVLLFNMPLVFGYSVVQCFLYGLIIYLTVFALMGLYSYIPWISDIIKSNFRD